MWPNNALGSLLGRGAPGQTHLYMLPAATTTWPCISGRKWMDGWDIFSQDEGCGSLTLVSISLGPAWRGRMTTVTWLFPCTLAHEYCIKLNSKTLGMVNYNIVYANYYYKLAHFLGPPLSKRNSSTPIHHPDLHMLMFRCTQWKCHSASFIVTEGCTKMFPGCLLLIDEFNVTAS